MSIVPELTPYILRCATTSTPDIISIVTSMGLSLSVSKLKGSGLLHDEPFEGIDVNFIILNNLIKGNFL